MVTTISSIANQFFACAGRKGSKQCFDGATTFQPWKWRPFARSDFSHGSRPKHSLDSILTYPSTGRIQRCLIAGQIDFRYS
jgi:hypothetical protein